jgi:uncharacterized membrane protein YqaE (UPF0057 family)
MNRYDVQDTQREYYPYERRSSFTATDLLKIICAVLLPPLGVFFEVGLTGHFWLNILLTLLGYLPGIIHALYVILRY